ncbi:arginine decarboxylase, pyruvoyl-dependent [Candidatus Woesearchaeota archaeon]|nr:arginine decarboxylase, pyruvoyl-dependent [Candidatus Woesearchaeota archaeon]
MNFVPKEIFFTKGIGKDKEKLKSFEAALRNAGIEKCNLVSVSSILPPNCKIISKEEGLKKLNPGQITFCVMARESTNEPNRLVSAAIGLAVPSEPEQYGYLSEHHGFGETEKKTGDYAEDLAATMLATTLGIEFDTDASWDEREQVYKASGKVFKSKGICQSAEADKEGKWTTVVAAAVFITEENGSDKTSKNSQGNESK